MTSAAVRFKDRKLNFVWLVARSLVGYNFLRNYKVVIDYPGEMLTLF